MTRLARLGVGDPPTLADPVSILVDDAIWPWRGRRWAHLVSDRSHEELHRFANRLGLRRVSFQDDHYDIDGERREAAIALGAAPVDSRELVRRLREAGLRRRGTDRRWSEVARAAVAGRSDLERLPEVLAPATPNGRLVDAAGHVAERALSVGGVRIAIAVLSRRDELAVLVVSEGGDGSAPDVPFEPRRVADLEVVSVSALGATTTVELFAPVQGAGGTQG